MLTINLQMFQFLKKTLKYAKVVLFILTLESRKRQKEAYKRPPSLEDLVQVALSKSYLFCCVVYMYIKCNSKSCFPFIYVSQVIASTLLKTFLHTFVKILNSNFESFLSDLERVRSKNRFQFLNFPIHICTCTCTSWVTCWFHTLYPHSLQKSFLVLYISLLKF